MLFFWNSLAFLYDSTNVGNFISGSSAFYKPRLYIWKFLVHILLKSSLKDFEHYFASIWNEWNFVEFELCTIWIYLYQIDCYFLFICLVLWVFTMLLLCCMFVCPSILFNLQCLWSLFCRLQGHNSYLWSLSPLGGIVVSCEDFSWGGLVSVFWSVELDLSKRKCCIQWCVIGWWVTVCKLAMTELPVC